MRDRRHLSRDDELNRGSSRPGVRPVPDAASGEILDLQERAGNRAVTRLLADVQRQSADAPTAGPMDQGASSGSPTMAIPEFELTVPLESFSMNTGGPRGREDSTGDLAVTFSIKHADPRLMRAMADGRRFPTITIKNGPMTITLTEVLIASHQMSSDHVTMTLNFASIDFGQPQGGSEREEGE